MIITDKKILRLLSKIENLSLKYHKLSLLFNELAGSLRIEAKQGKKFKELKESIKLDFDKVEDLTKINFTDLRKED